MTTITADNYSATAQAISDAIARSVSHTEIVTIQVMTDKRLWSVLNLLLCECDGSAESEPGTTEFWGADVDGNDWRVHVWDRSRSYDDVRDTVPPDSDPWHAAAER